VSSSRDEMAQGGNHRLWQLVSTQYAPPLAV
jgi:hypothetical protein